MRDAEFERMNSLHCRSPGNCCRVVAPTTPLWSKMAEDGWRNQRMQKQTF